MLLLYVILLCLVIFLCTNVFGQKFWLYENKDTYAFLFTKRVWGAAGGGGYTIQTNDNVLELPRQIV